MTDRLPLYSAPPDSDETIRIGRQKRKLAKQRDRILGLEKRVKELEHILATKHNLALDVTRAVQRALCNVRMIPVHGLSSTTILEVQQQPKPKS